MFHWVFEFPEVFLEKGGFDVVIGNPPHGAKIDEVEKTIWKANYSLVERGLDSAKTFIERSFLLLKNNAPLSFVIPKPSTYSYSWEDFRNYILNLEISHCIDLGKAFENVKHEQIVIIVWKRSNVKESYIGGYYNKSNGTVTEISTIPIKLVNSVGVLLSKLNEKEIAIVEYLVEQKFSDMRSFDIFRGLPRNLSSENGERCIKGKNIGRYFIRFPQEFVDVSTVNDNRTVRLRKKKIIAQRIVAHVTQPFDRIIIMAYPDMMRYLTFETVTNIVPEKEDVIKSTTLILNSRFVSWIVYSIIYNKAIRDMDFDAYFVKRIFLPDYENHVKYLNTICDFLLFLNADEDTNQSFAEIIDFIDGKLADSLVYELYFKQKFIEDTKKAIEEGKEPIYPQLENGPFLIDLVAKHLKPIDYESYAKLTYSLEPLSDEEKQKMEEMKEEYLKTIKEVVEAIKADKEIMELIERIKQHEWVRVIEGEIKDEN